MEQYFQSLYDDFYKSFIKENRYMYIFEGLRNTLIISACSAILGLLIGILIAYIKEKANYKKSKKYKILKMICNIYINIIRGTPVVLQLLIIYYIIFKGININPILIGIIAFGIASGAYTSEIIRAGINSVDKGQIEVAKSLGLNYNQRMRYIILPQAIKNILPALANEFILIVKDTSIAGYIGIKDLSKSATIISSRTYNYFFPLLIIAVIYLIIILTLTKIVGILEKRLKNA